MTEAQWAEVQTVNRWWKEFRRAWKSIGADFANREKLSPSPPAVLASLADLACRTIGVCVQGRTPPNDAPHSLTSECTGR